MRYLSIRLETKMPANSLVRAFIIVLHNVLKSFASSIAWWDLCLLFLRNCIIRIRL